MGKGYPQEPDGGITNVSSSADGPDWALRAHTLVATRADGSTDTRDGYRDRCFLTEQGERDDHGGGLEIDRDVALDAGGLGEDARRQGGDDFVGVGGAGLCLALYVYRKGGDLAWSLYRCGGWQKARLAPELCIPACGRGRVGQNMPAIDTGSVTGQT